MVSWAGDHGQQKNRDKTIIGHMDSKAQSVLLEPTSTFIMDFQPRSLGLDKGGLGYSLSWAGKYKDLEQGTKHSMSDLSSQGITDFG